MSTVRFRVVIVGLSFLFIFLSGFWLSRTGKPYNGLIFTIHKLVGLAMGVFLIMTIKQVHQVAPLGPVEITAIVVTALFFAATVTMGSLLSIGKPMPTVISMMNKLFPYPTVLSTVVTLYLLSRK
jgi:hypothetical protein